jgi:hypothetical protein
MPSLGVRCKEGLLSQSVEVVERLQLVQIPESASQLQFVKALFSGIPKIHSYGIGRVLISDCYLKHDWWTKNAATFCYPAPPITISEENSLTKLKSETIDSNFLESIFQAKNKESWCFERKDLFRTEVN